MGNSVPHTTYSSSRDGYSYSVTFEKKPFGEGVSRYAFRGKIVSDGPKDGTIIVTKVFKKQFAKHFDNWAPDVTASKKAQAFAEKFNKIAKESGIKAMDVSFRIPILLKVSDVAHFNILGVFPAWHDESYVRPGEWVAVEDFIEGDYVKFNNNGGYENQRLSELLVAFCHWTWEVSGRKFMICDLQGVRTGNGYLLTDPAVHSFDEIYGPTDLGIAGMEKVLRGHKCNRICQVLKLENPLSGSYRPGKQPRSKFYSFQLSAEEKLMNMNKTPKHFHFKQALMPIGE